MRVQESHSSDQLLAAYQVFERACRQARRLLRSRGPAAGNLRDVDELLRKAIERLDQAKKEE